MYPWPSHQSWSVLKVLWRSFDECTELELEMVANEAETEGIAITVRWVCADTTPIPSRKEGCRSLLGRCLSCRRLCDIHCDFGRKWVTWDWPQSSCDRHPVTVPCPGSEDKSKGEGNNDYYGLVLTPPLHLTVVFFLLSASYHLINQSVFFFRQETHAASIEKDWKLPKGAGHISEALESTLQGINVQWQACNSNSFIGNHINICLQVLYWNRNKTTNPKDYIQDLFVLVFVFVFVFFF